MKPRKSRRKRRWFLPFLAAAMASFLASPTRSEAADHFDMVETEAQNDATTTAERNHDISDFFVFANPEPGRQGRLVMIMNVNPRAHADTTFSNVIRYNFRLRTGPTREQGNEYRITCRFDAAEAQAATCQGYRVVDGTATPVARAIAHVATDDLRGGDNPKMRVFAGLRADPFFADALGLLTMVKTKTMPFGVGQVLPDNVRNVTHDFNDLAIVIDADLGALFGETGSIYRVAAETSKPRNPS